MTIGVFSIGVGFIGAVSPGAWHDGGGDGGAGWGDLSVGGAAGEPERYDVRGGDDPGGGHVAAFDPDGEGPGAGDAAGDRRRAGDVGAELHHCGAVLDFPASAPGDERGGDAVADLAAPGVPVPDRADPDFDQPAESERGGGGARFRCDLWGASAADRAGESAAVDRGAPDDGGTRADRAGLAGGGDAAGGAGGGGVAAIACDVCVVRDDGFGAGGITRWVYGR